MQLLCVPAPSSISSVAPHVGILVFCCLPAPPPQHLAFDSSNLTALSLLTVMLQLHPSPCFKAGGSLKTMHRMNNTSNGLPLPDPCVKMQLSHHLFHGIASSFELELGTVPETNYGHSHRLHSHWLS